MSVDIAELTPPQRFFKIDEVVHRIASLGIEIDTETIEYHMYATRKMPKPAKKVKRERYWTVEQIDQFVAAL